jgi:hypothetical protein
MEGKWLICCSSLEILKGNLINDLKPLSSLKNFTYLDLSNSPKLTYKTCPVKPVSICSF